MSLWKFSLVQMSHQLMELKKKIPKEKSGSDRHEEFSTGQMSWGELQSGCQRFEEFEVQVGTISTYLFLTLVCQNICTKLLF